MQTEGNGSVVFFIESDNQQIRYFFYLTFTHTIAKFFCTVIQFHTDICCFQCIHDFLCICIQTFIVGLNRHNTCLNRCQPGRQVSFGLFQNVCHETIQRSKNCAVQNNRCLFFSVAVNVGQIEFCRQAEVQLTGRQGNLVTDGRLYIDIQFRAIECSFSDFFGVFDSDAVHYITQCIFCCVPHLIIIMIFFFVFRITQRQYTTVIGDSEIFIGTEDQFYYFGKFILDLFRCYKQMGIVLTEMSSPFDTFQRSAALITEVMRNLTDTDRQVFIRMSFICINHHMMRTVHRTKNKRFPFHLHRREHVLFVVIPVAGSLIQVDSTNTRCHNMQITQFTFFFLDIIFQLLPDCISFRQEHRQTTSNQIVNHEQIHIFSNLSVISFFCFLQ